MAVVYGQRLPALDSVAAYSSQLLKEKQAEAEQRRAERRAFGKAIERRQEQYAIARNRRSCGY
jgi:hypothetical protein